MRALVLTAVSALALAACTVGPRYHSPSTPDVADKGFIAATPEAASLQPPPDRWWELYQVPELDALVQKALVHNTDLRVAAANLAQARGALLQSRAGLLPVTHESAGADYGKSSTANLLSSLTGKPAKAGWSYSAEFDASWEIDLWGRIRRGVSAAKADVQARQAAEDFVRVTVAAETTRAYVGACAYAEQVAVARRSLDLVTQSYQITQRQQQLGAASDFDVARAATLVEQTRATLPPLEDQRRAALFELAVLTCDAPERIDRTAAACTAPPRLTTPLPVGDGTALLRRRPDVREAERNLAAAVERVGVAVAGFFPTVTLGGNIAGGGSKPGAIFNGSGLSYSVGPLISWTLPNLVGQAGALQQAKAVSSGALAEFDGTVLGALKDTETSLSSYAAEIERHRALQAARDQGFIAFNLAKARYANGSASYLDVITAEQTLLLADQALAQSDGALSNDQVNVFKALGGGWAGAPAPVLISPTAKK